MTTETVEQITDEGGCPRCDAGHVVHTLAGGTAYLCELHVEGAHR